MSEQPTLPAQPGAQARRRARTTARPLSQEQQLTVLTPTIRVPAPIVAPHRGRPRSRLLGVVTLCAMLTALAWGLAQVAQDDAPDECGGGSGPGESAPICLHWDVMAGVAPLDAAKIANAPAPSTAISAPPLVLWPPSDPWTSVPGYRSRAERNARPRGASAPFGQCTYWAQRRRAEDTRLPWRDLSHAGDAWSYVSSAHQRGYPLGVTPVSGATVIFSPLVQGAGHAGHVGHVETVYPDGWFLVSEMNFWWNGGGWGRVDYRFAHAGKGVSFIY